VTDVRVWVGDYEMESVASLTLRLSMTELADSFTMVVNSSRPLIEQAERVIIMIQRRVVLVGRVQNARLAKSAGSRSFSVSGFSDAKCLVNSSALTDRPRGILENLNLAQIVVLVTEPFGLVVDIAPAAREAAGETIPKIKIKPGETGWALLSRVAKRKGCILVSGAASTDPDRTAKASVRITRTAVRESPVVLSYPHERIMGVDHERDFGDVHSEIIVTRKGGGTLDGDAGGVVGLSGTATDDRVPYSPKLIKAEKGGNTQAELDTQAEWEMRTRAAKSVRLSFDVSGWSPRPEAQDPDPLWWPNTLFTVEDREENFRESMVLSSVELILDTSGERARLTFNPPDMFAILKKFTISGGHRGWRADKDWLLQHSDLVTAVADESDTVQFNRDDLDLIFVEPPDGT
jgi:prophage tail gpP-like protein